MQIWPKLRLRNTPVDFFGIISTALFLFSSPPFSVKGVSMTFV